ncbi:S1 family peptidase [Embleya sp. NPDC055664]
MAKDGGSGAREPDSVLVSAVVRVRGADGTIGGAGFLVAPDLVLTCAHVVSDVLDLPRDAPVEIGADVVVDLPLADGTGVIPTATAEVLRWVPIRADQSGDAALLRLRDVLPGAVSLPMADAESVWDHRARVVGFTDDHPDGIWHKGTFSGPTGRGWVQLSRTTTEAAHVRPGFSGSPVWDDDLGAAVGLMVAAQPARDAQQTFVLRTRALLREFPELAPVLRPATPFRGATHPSTPRRRRTAVWSGVIATVVVLALVVLSVTDVIPLLDDHSDGARGRTGAPGGTGPLGATGPPSDLEVADVSFGAADVPGKAEDGSAVAPMPRQPQIHISLHNTSAEIAFIRNAVVTVTYIGRIADCRNIGGEGVVLPGYSVRIPIDPVPPVPFRHTVDFPGWQVAPKNFENISFTLGPDTVVAGGGWWAYRFTVSLERDRGRPALTTSEIAVLSPLDDYSHALADFESFAHGQSSPDRRECVANDLTTLRHAAAGATDGAPELVEQIRRLDVALR